jgi:hypothetical protein
MPDHPRILAYKCLITTAPPRGTLRRWLYWRSPHARPRRQRIRRLADHLRNVHDQEHT